jgi:hypothetical protein
VLVRWSARLAIVLALGCAATPPAGPVVEARPPAPPAVDAAPGGLPPCYPYRARGDRCPTACQTDADCDSDGWPLRCNGDDECVPLPPAEVHR